MEQVNNYALYIFKIAFLGSTIP